MRFILAGLLYLVLSGAASAQEPATDSLMVRWSGELPEGVPRVTRLPCPPPCEQNLHRSLRPLISDLILAGYPGAGMDSLSYISGQPTAWLSCGPFIGKAILVDGNAPVPFEMLDSYLDSLVYSMACNGYPYAMVRLTDISLSDAAPTARLQVDSGILVRFEGYRQQGQVKLADDYLFALTGLDRGMLFDESIVSKLGVAIGKDRSLRSANSPQVIFRDSLFEVVIFPEKREANQVWGILGIVSNPDGGGNVRLSGEASARFSQLIGHGDVFSFGWRGTGQGSQELELELKYPYIAGWDIGSEADFMLRKVDSLFIQNAFNLGIYYIPSPGQSIGGTFGLWKGSELGGEGKTVDRRLSGIKVAISRLNRAYNPAKGFRVNASIRTGTAISGKTEDYDGEERASRFDASLTATHFLALSTQLSLMTAIRGQLVAGPGIGEIEYFRVGGNRDLRGYDEQEFLAPAYGIAGLELRYLPDPSNRLAIFWDLVYLDQSPNAGIHHGFGIGAGINTAAGMLILQYALPKRPHENIQFRNGKVHIGIEARF